MKLSILIPVHNEAPFVAQVVKDVFALRIEGEKEIIVVDDGSTDDTSQILENLSKNHKFKLLTHKVNLGKGAAIRTGLKEVTGDLVIIQDADLEYSVQDIPILLKKINSGISAVYGARGNKKWPKRGYHYMLGARLLTFTINALYKSQLTDVYTGYKLFNLSQVGKVLKTLESDGFEFEAEITCKILKSGGRIIEEPISYTPRSITEGKHIKPWDAVVGLYTIFRSYLN